MADKTARRRPLAPTSINAIISHPNEPVDDTIKPILPPVSTILHQTLQAQPTKRKAIEIEDEDGEDPDEDLAGYVTENCDQIRRKIDLFLGTGEMKVGEFQKAIGVNSKGYSMFMGQTGRDKGSGSNTYYAASKFFKLREMKGIKIKPTKKVKKGEEKKDDVSHIHLDGEAEVNVPVYESCDEVRKKIRAYLRDPGVTQAGFLREVGYWGIYIVSTSESSVRNNYWMIMA
jgi:hypothetical protein